jgi:hypothetical protein
MADAIATEVEASNRPLGLRAWFLEERRAGPIDVYRLVVGGWLVFHFARAWQDLPKIVGREGIYLPSAEASRNAFSVTAFAWVDGHLNWARACTGLCIAASCALAAGVRPRWCAALLFFLSSWILRVGSPAMSLDDRLVAIVAFWFCLLPTGAPVSTWWRTLRGSAESWPRVEGWTTSLMLVHWLVLHTDFGLWLGGSADALGRLGALAVLFVVPACLVVPNAVVRFGGVMGLLGLHAYLVTKTGLTFAHAAMASSAVLFWSDRPPADRHKSARPFGVGGALGLTVIALNVVAMASPLLWWSNNAAATVLWDAGLLAKDPDRPPPSPEGLAVQPDGGEVRALEPDFWERPRFRLLARYLLAGSSQDPSLSKQIATSAIARHCRSLGSSGETGRLSIVWKEGKLEAAWYECSQDGPHIVAREKFDDRHLEKERTPSN